ncbi:MAG: hemolysin family protein [Micrococcales bacterium]|nr:hemolysin family protein [Micrococcales bacterium]
MITALLISVGLLAANAFFVAAEFALVASKRHRLEDAARKGSRGARAAVRASHELSMMLAGAQLGITVCTLLLGALAKPAVAALLEPVLTVARLPQGVAGLVSVILAVSLVVFLHMVVGEMAPKSWAITHPERSAILLALPFRSFASVVRPLLFVLNATANGCIRLFGVTPQPELAQAHGPRELQLLLRSSHEHGLIAEPEHRVLAGAINLDTLPLTAVMVPLDRVVTIAAGASAADAEALCRATGRSRLVVTDGTKAIGMVHIRDILRVSGTAAVSWIMTPPKFLAPELSLLDAVSEMRAARAQLVLVGRRERAVGLVTMEDLLEQVLGQFEDETDR